MLLPLLMTTIAGLSTGLGGLIAALFRPTPRLMAFCGGFAGAVMLTVSLADLAPALLDFYGALLSPFGCGAAAAALLLGGMLAAWLLACALPDEDTLADRFGSRTQGSAMRAALVTGAALLLHNLPEGIDPADQRLGPAAGGAHGTGDCPAQYPGGIGCCGAFCLRHRQPGQGCRGCAGIRPCGTGGGRFGGTGAGPTVDAGTFERHCGCGGGHYAVGGGCPAAARGV